MFYNNTSCHYLPAVRAGPHFLPHFLQVWRGRWQLQAPGRKLFQGLVRQTTMSFDSGTTRLWRQIDPVVVALVSEQRREKIGRKVAKTRLTCYLQIRVCGLFMALQDAEESISPTVCWSRSPRWVSLRVSLEGSSALAIFYSLFSKKQKKRHCTKWIDWWFLRK